MRKVCTVSGAVAVQVMRKAGRRDEVIEHIGSARTDAELGVLLERARRLATDRLKKMATKARDRGTMLSRRRR